MKQNHDLLREHEVITEDSLITLTDKGTGIKITFDNKTKEEYVKIKIDGGVIKNSEDKKADYLLQKTNCGQIIIELKGKNLETAAKQIASTFNFLKNKTKYDNKTAILIVAKKSPKIGFAQASKIIKKECKLILPPVKTTGSVIKFEDFVK
jgi:hypothetical protein